MATLKIINRDICKTPVIVKVERIGYDTIRITFDSDSVNNVDYFNFEYSTDGAVTWTTYPTNFGGISPMDIVVTNFIGFPPEQIIFFRIKSFSERCGFKYSNSVSFTWGTAVQPGGKYTIPPPDIRCDDGSGQGPTGFNIWCDGTRDFRFMDVLNTTYGFIRFASNMVTPNPFGFQYTGGGAIVIGASVPVTSYVTLVYADMCSGTYYCTPPYPHMDCYIQYSGDGTNWINLDVKT